MKNLNIGRMKFPAILLGLVFAIALVAQAAASFFDAKTQADAIREKRTAAHNELYAKGDYSLESHRKIDNAALNEAGSHMESWDSAQDALFKKAGVKPPKGTGTDPNAGRRILGDKDLANMNKADFDRMVASAESMRGPNGEKYTIKRSGNSVTIEELKLTMHQKGDPNQSPYDKAAGDETFLSLKTDKKGNTVMKDGKAVVKDAHLYNMDNLKKGGHLFDKPSSNMSDTDVQELAKTTKKMLENTYGQGLKKCPPDKLAKYTEIYKKCNDLKLEITRHSTGLGTDDALSQFQKDCKEAASSSLKKTDADSAKKVEGLEAKARNAEANHDRAAQNLENAKKLGNPDGIAKAQADYDATAQKRDFTREQASTYKGEKNASEWAVKNKKGASVLNDLRGVKTPETGKGVISLKQNEPLNLEKIKTPTPGGVDSPATRNVNITSKAAFLNKLNIVDGIIGMKQTYDYVGNRLPDDMDPYLKKGTQAAAAITSAAGLPIHTGIITGYDTAMDELTQYYIDESNGRTPSWTAMQARAAAKTAGKIAYDFSIGIAVQPLINIKDIGESIGGAIYDYNQCKKTLLRNARQQAETAEDAIDDLNQLSSGLERLTEAIKTAGSGLQADLDKVSSSQDSFARRYEDLMKSKEMIQSSLTQAASFRSDIDAGRIPKAGADVAGLITAVDKGASAVCAMAPPQLKMLQDGKTTLEELRKSVAENIEPPFESAEDAYVKIEESLKSQLESDPRYVAVNANQKAIEGILQDSAMYNYALESYYARIKSVATVVGTLPDMIATWDDLNRRFASGASYFANKSYDVDPKDAAEIKAKLREIEANFKAKRLSIDKERALSSRAQSSFEPMRKAFEKAAAAPDLTKDIQTLSGAMEMPSDAISKVMTALPGFQAAEAKLTKAGEWMAKLKALCMTGEATIAVTVKDASGAGQVFGAMVRLKGAGLDQRKGVGQQGAAVFVDLLPGRYDLEASADGYSSATECVVITAEDSRKEVSLSLKASGKAAARNESVEPERKKEEEPAAKAVPDEELKNAMNAFSGLMYAPVTGTFATKANIISMRDEKIIDGLMNYSKAKTPYGAMQFAFMMDASNPAISDILAQAFTLQAVQAQYEALNAIYYSGLNYQYLALMRNGLKRDSKESSAGAPEAAKALALIEFSLAVVKNRSLDISDFSLWNSYRKFQDAKWGVKAKTDYYSYSDYEKFDGSKWVALASTADGYAKVAKEMDSFWASAETLEFLKKAGETKFKAANPDIVQDYRAKYIELAITPAMKTALKKAVEAQFKTFLKSAKSFVAAWDGASITLNGSLRIGPDQAPPVTLTLYGLSKEPVKQTVDGAFVFTKPLKEVCSSSYRLEFSLDRQKIGEDLRVDTGRSSSGYVNLFGGHASVSGFNFRIDVPPFRFSAHRYARPKYAKGQGIVELPQRPVDMNSSCQSQLGAVIGRFQSGEIGEDEARAELDDICYAINSYVYGAYTPKINAVQSALRHNRDYEESQLKAQGAGGDQINPVLRSYEAKISELTKQENAYVKAASDMQSAARKAYEERYKKIYSSLEALMKERKGLEAESTKLYDACYKSRDALGKPMAELYSLMSSVQSNRKWEDSPQWNPTALEPSFDKRIPESLQTASAYPALFQEFDAKVEPLLQCRAGFQRLAAEAAKILRMRYGSKIDEAMLLRNSSSYRDYVQLWRQDTYAGLKLMAMTLKDLDIPSALAAAERKGAIYAERRGGALKNIDALIAELEKTVAGMPAEDEVAKAEAEFAPVADKVLSYTIAISSAVLSGSASAVRIDGSLLDAKGSDSAFLHEALGVMRSIHGGYRSSVEPWMSECFGSGDSAMEKVYRLMFKISSCDFTEAQRKRYDESMAKWSKSQRAYKKLYYFACMKLLEAVESAGRTPSDRVKFLLGKNEEVKAWLKGMQGRLPSADAEDISRLYKELKTWDGMMPDCPTLENVKLRCEIYKEIARSGVPASCREALKKPAPPPWIEINGTKVTYDGSCVIMRYSQLPGMSAEMTKNMASSPGGAGKFQKSYMVIPPPERQDLRLENSMMGDRNFYPFYYGRPMEYPLSREYLPMLFTWHFRYVDKVTGASSNFMNEPGLTIIILP